jgi:hypothetical protein
VLLQVASNLSQSARSGSEGIVISSPGSRPASDCVEDPKTNKAVPLQDFSLQGCLLKRNYWDTKFSIGKDAIFGCTPVRKGDQLISTWVLIRKNSRLIGGRASEQRRMRQGPGARDSASSAACPAFLDNVTTIFVASDDSRTGSNNTRRAVSAVINPHYFGR